MKKNIYSFIVLTTIIILIINIFTKSQYLTDIIVYSSNLFIKNIFPSLFPMFVISSILVEIGIPDFLGSKFNKLFKVLFKSSGFSSFVFFMSMLTGFPSSAKYINDLINNKKIDNNEAEKILTFTFFSNPLFIINTVGTTFFNSKKLGFAIFIAHLIGNIITGLIFRNYKEKKDVVIKSTPSFHTKDLIQKINNTNIFKTILNSISNSLEILINIFGIVTFTLILVNMVFKSPNNYLEIFISGSIEMTSGLKYLTNSALPSYTKIVTATFFLSFGGLSVHAQIMNILKEKKVKYLPFLISRTIHAIISALIIFSLHFLANQFPHLLPIKIP